jgi:hypothetical protein
MAALSAMGRNRLFVCSLNQYRSVGMVAAGCQRDVVPAEKGSKTEMHRIAERIAESLGLTLKQSPCSTRTVMPSPFSAASEALICLIVERRCRPETLGPPHAEVLVISGR